MDRDYLIRNLEEERIYHNTAILIYLKAARDIMGSVEVRIGNSLNQGYFSYAAHDHHMSYSDIRRIRSRMESIIGQDMPITIEHDNAAHAMSKWASLGYHEKARLLECLKPDDIVDIDEIGGYRNCMYCKVLPSTGYIKLFEIRPYRNGLLLRLPNALNPDSLPPYRDDDKLYDAYAECKRMRKHTGIGYLADLNERIREGKSADVIRASEWLQTKQINEFADMIVSQGKRVVLIAGPSSSGKTTTAKRLCAAIAEKAGDPLYLGTDDYFVERTETPLGPDGKPDFEGLGALDLKLFNQQMEDLLAGREVDLPEFDFVKGAKIFGKRITSLKEGQILVIEGIHSLNDILTENIARSDKFKIYISPLTQIAVDRHNRLSTADARLLRRMVRDNQFRAYNAEATLETWPKVRAGESVNIFPYSSSADVVFNSSTVYETNLLRKYAEPLLREIAPESPMYSEAQRILSFLRYFEYIESSDAVPDNSILREFIGKKPE